MNAHPSATPFPTRDEFDTAVVSAAEAAKAFYDTETLAMTDATYDLLVDRIALTRAAHPDWDDAGVTTDVAGGQSGGGEVTHSSKMKSLDKVTDTNPEHDTISEVEEFNRFLDNAARGGYSVEVKMDGNAGAARYKNGRLVLLATRGDGDTGDDVTPSALRDGGIKGLPLTLNTPWTGEVRGEVFMTEADFEIASNNRVQAGGKPFANPRNATSGSLRAFDRTYEAPMSFAAYSIHEAQDSDTTEATHEARMARASSLGFITAASLTPTLDGTTIHDSAAAAKAAVVRIKQSRDDLGFPIDGAVIAYNTDEDRAKVGEGNRAPKWALAWKYPPREAESVLRSVEVAVGKTGRMSLTAHIDPVYVDGSTVSKASGHNAPKFMAWGMGVGHRVMVVKRGDIIPYISLLDGPQDPNVTPWVAPDTCPKCGEEWDKSSLLWRCHTPECSIAGRIAWFASRECMDIEGLGATVAEALAEAKYDDGTEEGADLVKDVADLYDLTFEQWANLPMGTTLTGNTRVLGEGNATKIMKSLEERKAQPLNRLITALGIRMTGRSVGRWLASEFHTMERLRAATYAEVETIHKLGDVKARHIVDGLANLAGVLDRLAAHGVNMGSEPVDDGTPKPFEGRTYVISGSVPGFTRTTAQEAVERLGGKASSSVSKTTTALVVEEGSTSSKAKKAESLGVEMIDPEVFAAMLAEHGITA